MTSIVLRILVYAAAIALIVTVIAMTYIKDRVWATSICPALIAAFLSFCGMKDMKEMLRFRNAKKYGDDAYGIVISCVQYGDYEDGIKHSMHYLMLYVNTITLAKQEITGLEVTRFGRPGEFIHIKIYQGEKFIVDRVADDRVIPIEVKDKLLDIAKTYI